MGVGAGLYMCDVVKKSSRSLSHLLMSSCLSMLAMNWNNASFTNILSFILMLLSHSGAVWCPLTHAQMSPEFAPRSESANKTLANSLPVTFAPGPIRLLALSLPGTYTRRSKMALELPFHICCGQMAAWINMPLGMEVSLGPGHFVLDYRLQK